MKWPTFEYRNSKSRKMENIESCYIRQAGHDETLIHISGADFSAKRSIYTFYSRGCDYWFHWSCLLQAHVKLCMLVCACQTPQCMFRTRFIWLGRLVLFLKHISHLNVFKVALNMRPQEESEGSTGIKMYAVCSDLDKTDVFVSASAVILFKHHDNWMKLECFVFPVCLYSSLFALLQEQ